MKSLLYIKRRLFQTKVNLTGIIVNGLIHHTPKQKILGQIKKEISYISGQIRLNRVETNSLYIQSINQYNAVSKHTASKLRNIDKKFGKKEDYEINLKQRTSVLYNTVRKQYIQNNRLVQERNDVAYSVEHRLKHDAIYDVHDGLLADARSRATYSPFFLCSAHPHPAKDHRDWESKCFYDEDWKNYVEFNSTDYYRIESYIRNHKLYSLQYITGPDVYLGTRKNCKHYFKNIPLEDIMHNSRKKLITKYKMWMPDEKPASTQILTYRKYYERLKTLEMLEELIPNDELSTDIRKTRKVLQKWS